MKDVVKTNIKRPESSKRLKRRRRNQSVYYFIVILLVLGVGISLSMTLLFNIEQIEIIGESQYTAEEIIEVSEVGIGDNLVRLKADEVKDNILNNLIYIEDVKVKKAFPDSLQLEIIKSIPSAVIEYAGIYIEISQDRKILEVKNELNDDLIVFKGIIPINTKTGEKLNSKDEQKIKILDTLRKEIENQQLSNVIYVDMNDIYDIKLYYDNRIEVDLGKSTKLDYKISYVKKILEEEIGENEEGYLIMRDTNGASFVEKKDMERYKESLEKKNNETSVETESEIETTEDNDIPDYLE